MRPEAWCYDPTRWPCLTEGEAGTGGAIRREFEDFQVDEDPAFAPSGSGEHVLVRIRKVDRTTPHVIGELARALDLPPDALGHAGLKDRRAVTTQWLSVPARALPGAEAWPELAGVELLELHLHDRKLQPGALAANRFAIRVRGAAGEASRAEALLVRLAAEGVPNYFGPQRFGRDGDNARAGLAILARGRKPRRWLEELQAQALQSWIFNDWVAARLGAGTLGRVLQGDIAEKHATGGKFQVGDVAAELPRALAFEISPTGPLPGRKYHESAEEARLIEDAVLAAAGLTRDTFRPLPGSRRAGRIRPGDAGVEPAVDGYWVRFTLPPGAYATAVLREIVKGPLEGEP